MVRRYHEASAGRTAKPPPTGGDRTHAEARGPRGAQEPDRRGARAGRRTTRTARRRHAGRGGRGRSVTPAGAVLLPDEGEAPLLRTPAPHRPVQRPSGRPPRRRGTGPRAARDRRGDPPRLAPHRRGGPHLPPPVQLLLDPVGDRRGLGRNPVHRQSERRRGRPDRTAAHGAGRGPGGSGRRRPHGGDQPARHDGDPGHEHPGGPARRRFGGGGPAPPPGPDLHRARAARRRPHGRPGGSAVGRPDDRPSDVPSSSATSRRA